MANGFDQPHIANLLDKSTSLATSLSHEYVTLEHISLILLEDSTVSEAIKNCGLWNHDVDPSDPNYGKLVPIQFNRKISLARNPVSREISAISHVSMDSFFKAIRMVSASSTVRKRNLLLSTFGIFTFLTGLSPEKVPFRCA